MSQETTPSNLIDPKPFKLDERQGVVYDYLKRLVSQSAAAFYEDACRHMSVRPPFNATTNIVGHLVREIESSLRDVLEPISKSEIRIRICKKCDKKKDCKKNNHSEDIELIVGVMGLPKEFEKLWLSIPSDGGFQKYAHRKNLDQIREMDDDFGEFWTKVNTILRTVLDRFEERYDGIVARLDTLAQKTNPTKSDADILCRNIPNNNIAHAHFFNQLNNPAWLSLLKSRSILSDIPKPEVVNMDDGSTGLRRTTWPASNYLERMIEINPRAVFEVLDGLIEVDNPDAKSDLLRIVAKLPKIYRQNLFEKIKKWMKTDLNYLNLLLTESGMSVIEKFVEDDDEEKAFELVGIILEIFPISNNKSGENNEYDSLDSQTRLGKWHYADFLEKEFTKLVNFNPERSLEFVCESLSFYLKQRYKNRKQKEYFEDDQSHYYRAAIEEHSDNREREDVRDALVTSIRDIALGIIKDNPEKIAGVIEKLEKYKVAIFRRISLYLLGESSEKNPEFLAMYLTNKSLFSNYCLEHEYTELLTKKFKFLNAEQKKVIYDYIKEAPEVVKYIKNHKDPLSQKDKQKLKGKWQRDRLYFIKADLPEYWKKTYEQFVSQFGEPENPGSHRHPVITDWVAPSCDVKSEDLVNMSDDEIVKLLKEWQPKSTSHWDGPTKDTLGDELKNAVKQNPKKFIEMANKLKGLDPTYIRSYLQGVRDIIQQDQNIEWDNLLDLCDWTANQEIIIPGRSGGVMDQDPDWNWARKEIASIISTGLNKNLISYGLRERLWSAIEKIISKEPYGKDDEDANDPYTVAINSTIGESLHAVVEYALWVRRNIEKDPAIKDLIEKGFDLMPEVAAVLDLNLDSTKKPSIAARAVFGRFFPWLLLLDKEWSSSNVEKIFPSGKFEDPLYMAAWDTLMLYVAAYNEPFKVLKGKYHEAIFNLGKVDKDKKRYTDRDERLAEHLMLFYGRGLIELSDELLEMFWEKADKKIRGHALDFVGRSLKDEKGKIEIKILERFTVLWESRIAKAEAAINKNEFEDEMAAFGWWFALGKFDIRWSCNQYLKALEIGKKDQSDHMVVEHLLEIVKIMPVESIKILGKVLLSRDRNNWIVVGNKDEISQILICALSAPESEAGIEAKSLINRLSARGYSDFSQLLPPNE